MTLDFFNPSDLGTFYLRVIVSGLMIACVAGPIGCLLIWRRLAFFGDAIAHSALLGVALGMALGCSIYYSVIAVCAALSWVLSTVKQRTTLSFDTHLALLSNAILAFGLLGLSLLPQTGGDFNAFLFGDLLTLSSQDMGQIVAVSTISLSILMIYWKRFLIITLSEDMAAVEGYPVGRIRFVLFILIGIFVATAAKAVGVLLMTSLLIIPAATARLIAKSPLQMAVLASVISMLCLLAGLLLSWHGDLPLSPTIVIATLLALGASFVYKGRK